MQNFKTKKMLGYDFQTITIIKLRDHKICHSEAAWYKINILKWKLVKVHLSIISNGKVGKTQMPAAASSNDFLLVWDESESGPVLDYLQRSAWLTNGGHKRIRWSWELNSPGPFSMNSFLFWGQTWSRQVKIYDIGERYGRYHYGIGSTPISAQQGRRTRIQGEYGSVAGGVEEGYNARLLGNQQLSSFRLMPADCHTWRR